MVIFKKFTYTPTKNSQIRYRLYAIAYTLLRY